MSISSEETNGSFVSPGILTTAAAISKFDRQRMTTWSSQNTNLPSDSCLSPVCIQNIASQLAHAFPDRTNHSKWCIHNATTFRRRQGHSRHGLQLVKTFKSASSTTAAVILQISRQLGCLKEYTHWQHRPAKEFSNRLPWESFLLTSVHDPGKCAMSSIFYHHVSFASHEQGPPSDESLIQYLKNDARDPISATSNGQGGYTVRYANPSKDDIPHHAFWTSDQLPSGSKVTSLKAAPWQGNNKAMVEADSKDKGVVKEAEEVPGGTKI